MNIIVDAMGSDYGPGEIVKGCLDAAKELEVTIIIVGQEEIIKKELSKKIEGYYDAVKRIKIVNASEVIDNSDTPTKAIKGKKDSSMVVGLKMLKESKGDAFISAGNTGALLTGSLLLVGRIKGIDRPALAPIIPTDKSNAIIVDAGANLVCKTINYVQFGIMGSKYMENMLEINNPKVALVNVGIEESKGSDVIKKAYSSLKKMDINFIGNIEARQIPDGYAEVIVCDGFVGNVVLKLIEGMAITFNKNIKEIFMTNIFTKLAALLVKSSFKKFKKRMDYSEHGGAPFLGIDGIVIKIHGSSKASSVYHAICQASKFIKTDVISQIKTSIEKTGGDIDYED